MQAAGEQTAEQVVVWLSGFPSNLAWKAHADDRHSTYPCGGFGQTFPHAPQFEKSESSATHAPAQSVRPAGQAPPPPLQEPPSGAGVPHAPQFSGSLVKSTQVAPQRVSVSLHGGAHACVPGVQYGPGPGHWLFSVHATHMDVGVSHHAVGALHWLSLVQPQVCVPSKHDGREGAHSASETQATQLFVGVSHTSPYGAHCTFEVHSTHLFVLGLQTRLGPQSTVVLHGHATVGMGHTNG
jgi:hypothetical protein